LLLPENMWKNFRAVQWYQTSSGLLQVDRCWWWQNSALCLNIWRTQKRFWTRFLSAPVHFAYSRTSTTCPLILYLFT
jgi:hypothetical protein